MIHAHWKKYTLQFKQASGTSRGVLRTKDSYFLFLEDKETAQTAIGECGILRGLSYDDRPDYEQKLTEICQNSAQLTISSDLELNEFPSIQFGLEMAICQFIRNRQQQLIFPSEFTKGNARQAINGLVWMGSADFMQQQIKEKISAGFRCIKMKIGAIDFETELELLKGIRKQFSPEEIELRVDANGAFSPQNALEKLKRLADLQLHSIEQPIRQGQLLEMAKLCATTPLPIALDEELIGISDLQEKKKLLDTIQPQYIILKPSLIGGFRHSNEWISLAEQHHIDWWATSALESNIGLSAIAQWVFTHKNPLPQGLGTGQLYTNNFESPLYIKSGEIGFNPLGSWDLSPLF